MNIINRIFMFLILSTTIVCLGMTQEEKTSTLEGLRRWTTESLGQEIEEVTNDLRRFEHELDLSQHQLQQAETEAERARIEPGHNNLKTEKDWNTNYLELLQQVRDERS